VSAPPPDGFPLPVGLAPVESVERPEDALIAAAQQGDVRAFEALLLAHEGKVLRVLRFLGVSSADREDVAQEVFVRVFRHLGGFRPGRPFGAWIYRITVNAAHDWRLHKAPGMEDLWSASAESVCAPDPDPEQAAEAESLRRQLEQGLRSLSERERSVFVLRELEGLETVEVARALGITTITVRRHLGRARDHLRRLLHPVERSPGKAGSSE